MKQGWEYKKLGEVAPIICGKDYKSVLQDNGQYPIYGSGGIMGYASEYRCPENCTIVGRKGSINNPLFVTTKFWNVDTAFGLNPKLEFINPKYLYYFCTNFDFNTLNVAVTLPSLRRTDVENISISIPPLTTQQSIVSELDTLSQIIADYKEQLADYDKLEQSIFYDMFGDPVKNEKGWEVKKFGQIFKLKSGDGLSTKDFINGEMPVYGGNGISGYHNQFNKKGKFIIIGRVGAYCGNVRCVEGEFWLTDNAFELFFDIKSFDFQWLNRMLNTINLQQYANHAAQPVISNNGLKDIEVIIPPLPLQQQFASKIESIEQMKADTKAALQDAELLFQSRMDYWFNA